MVRDKLIPSWYVLHTKSRFENVVNEGLLKKSFDAFLPKIQTPSKRRDRKVVLRVPLFPGYVFVKTGLDPRQQLEVLKTAGVVRFIGNKDGPIPVPSDTIESLSLMVSSDRQIFTGARFEKGDKVIVISGPFTGVTGEFSQFRGQGRVVVHIDALGQFAGVEVGESDIEIIP